MKKMCKNYGEKGQALLIVVLIMVVSLTIGLSVATRSITNVRNSTEEADSQKAFSAAEAGVEQALKGVTPNPNVNFSGTEKIPAVNIVPQGGTGVTNFLLAGGKSITKDEGVDLWLVTPESDGHIISDGTKGWPDENGASGSFTIYWDNQTSCDAAIEIIILSVDLNPTAHPISTRYAYDCDPSRHSSNNFTDKSSSAGKTISTIPLKYNTDSITLTRGLIARIIPIYGNPVIGVDCTSPCFFPEQGNLISSTGQSGQAQRKIKVFQQKYPSLPAEFFRYALLAP